MATQTTKTNENAEKNVGDENAEGVKRLPHSLVTAMPKNSVETNVCRNFVHSECRYGDKCIYPHFIPKVCPYFSFHGSCKFGDRCFYSHPKNCVVPRWEDIERSADYMNPFDEKADEIVCPTHRRIGEWIEVMQVTFYRMNLEDVLDDETVWEKKPYVRNAPLPPTDIYFESIRTQDYKNFYIFSYDVFSNEAQMSQAFDRKQMEIIYPKEFNDWTVFSSHGLQGNFWGFQLAVFTNYFYACITGGEIAPVVLEIVDV